MKKYRDTNMDTNVENKMGNKMDNKVTFSFKPTSSWINTKDNFINIKYDVKIPEGLTPEEEENLLQKIKNSSVIGLNVGVKYNITPNIIRD